MIPPIRLALLASTLLTAVLSGPVAATPAFVNGLTLDGGLLDKSGGSTANDGRVGFFSDLYYDPNRQQWWGLSDGGPGGGTLSYETRVQRFTLAVNSATGAISNFTIVDTILFRDASNQPFNGLEPSPSSTLGSALDPEGFVILPKTGTFLVSDEYGPSLYEFDRSGTFVRAYDIPAALIPRNSTGTPNYASDTGNTAGRRSNRGFEGLAVSPDGRYAFAMLQSAMLDEGGSSEGRFTRIVKFDSDTGKAVAQYAYLLDRSNQGQGISALVALNDSQFLVLERNNQGLGIDATLATPFDKLAYLIDISSATDVTGLTLPASGTMLPPGVVGVSKMSKLIDLAADTLADLGNKVPDKWEGLTFGPTLADGSFLLLAGTDNDYSVARNGSNVQFDVYLRVSDADPYSSSIQCPIGFTTGCSGPSSTVPTDGSYQLLPGVLQAYRIPAADLPAYQAPVPGPLPLLGAASALAWSRRLRRRIAGR
ncbi:MAG: esterase-like activity of phytase family protein [Cyanobacteriota bacterium]